MLSGRLAIPEQAIHVSLTQGTLRVFRASPQVEAIHKPAADADSVTAAPRRDLSPLRRLVPFLKPYRAAIAGACLALTVAAGTVLVLGAARPAEQVLDCARRHRSDPQHEPTVP